MIVSRVSMCEPGRATGGTGKGDCSSSHGDAGVCVGGVPDSLSQTSLCEDCSIARQLGATDRKLAGGGWDEVTVRA